MKKQWYEVWILGEDENGHATDYENFCEEFADRKSAAQAFKEYQDEATRPDLGLIPPNVKKLRLALETVEFEDGVPTCVDVVETYI